MMRVCVITQDEAVAALVREGTRAAEAKIFKSSDEFIKCVLAPDRPGLIFIDLTSIKDGLRAVQFIKSSSEIRSIPVIVIVPMGQPDPEIAISQPDGVLVFPFSADEVAALATRRAPT